MHGRGLLALLATLALASAGEGLRLVSRYGDQLGGRQAGGYLVLLGAALMILAVVAWRRGELAGGGGEDTAAASAGGVRRVAVCMAILAGYLFLTPRLGYLTSTVLFFLAYLRVLGGYRWPAAIALSGLFGIGSAVVFAQAGMMLPRGPIAWP